MKRIVVVIIALLSILLAGCGQTADSEPPEPENVPDVPAQEEPAPPEPVFPEELQAQLPEHLRGPLLEVLAQDPRAAYNKKPDYIYGMAFADYDIRFTVAEGILTVKEVTRRTQEWKKVK